MAVVIILSDFGTPKNEICHCFHFFPFYCSEVMGPDAMILFFFSVEFQQLETPTMKYNHIVFNRI